MREREREGGRERREKFEYWMSTAVVSLIVLINLPFKGPDPHIVFNKES